MPSWVKLLTGFVAVLFMGWLSHGPLGGGERLLERIEAAARAKVAATGVPGIAVRLGRDPMARIATLSGPADDFQRDGMGQLPGLTDIVSAVPGIAGVRWADTPAMPGERVMPLLAETLIPPAVAYGIGVMLALLVLRRKPRRGFY